MAYQSDIDVQEDLAVISMSESFFEKFMTDIADGYEKMEFLPTMLKGSMRGLVEFESMVNHMARELSTGYDSGDWDYAKSKQNDTFMIYPSSDKSFHVVNNCNYSEAMVDARIFGVIINMMVFSHGSIMFYKIDSRLSDILGNHYHALRESFYDLVDSVVHDPESTATDEEKEQVRAMSGAVYSILD